MASPLLMLLLLKSVGANSIAMLVSQMSIGIVLVTWKISAKCSNSSVTKDTSMDLHHLIKGLINLDTVKKISLPLMLFW